MRVAKREIVTADTLADKSDYSEAELREVQMVVSMAVSTVAMTVASMEP
jgi:hypothetical protein